MATISAIPDWISAKKLPEVDLIYESLLDSPEKFVSTEGEMWDFKESWPFSYSDKYFAGICRLICAFANSSGGIIVFGVHDEKRIGGRNKVVPNIDKLSSSFKSLTGYSFEFDFRSYSHEANGDIDVLLVLPRPINVSPIRFNKTMGGYLASKTWYRDGHEVVKALPTHFPQLFCRLQHKGFDSSLNGSLPPSNAQIKKFVGRTEVITELFDWLQNSDEPRTYLYGKGGSGKTTIAREFAKLVKNFGQNLEVEGTDKLDLVIFISAKERELISVDAKVSEISDPDFNDEISLLRQVLEQSGCDLEAAGAGSDIKQLRLLAVEYFNNFSYLLVLDDIDTLTTKGVDSGSDFLYRILSRSKKRSKVLYTLRNAPSQSLHNSIEVPGLHGDEYVEFVNECVNKFNVKAPEPDFMNNQLAALSERRPLVIESIIALVRTSGSYNSAEKLFVQNVGDDIRDYVFKREWDALSGAELPRLLLAALVDLNRPSTFDDLQTVLQAGDSSIRDAIGTVREMFLSVDSAGEEALFSLAPLTRGFVNSRKESVKYYGTLQQRVINYKKKIKISPPQVVRIVILARRYVPLRNYSHTPANCKEALRIVREATLKASITEDPLFRATKGYVEALQKNPDMSAVRENFLYCLQMDLEPEIEELTAWLEAEKRTGVIESHISTIADVVMNGRKYSEEDKIGMMSRKATTIFNQARDAIYTDSTRADALFEQSLLLHLKAFKLNANLGTHMVDVSEKYARNTAHQWFRLSCESRDFAGLMDKFEKLLDESDGFLDPIEEPLRDQLNRIGRSNLTPSERGRLKNGINKVLARSLTKDKWLDVNVWSILRADLQRCVTAIRR